MKDGASKWLMEKKVNEADVTQNAFSFAFLFCDWKIPRERKKNAQEMTKKTAQKEMANANVSVAPLEKDCLMFMCTQYTFDSVFLFAFAVFFSSPPQFARTSDNTTSAALCK